MNNNSDNSNPAGEQIHDLVSRLFPICRSQTGDGVRQSLEILRELLPLELLEIPSGTKVFDWEVPQEWNISDAWITDESGTRVVDFRESNLHVVNGSTPIRQRMPWSELKSHLVTLPEQPELIPYRTAFFQNKWGFCVSQRQFDVLEARGECHYDVCIDASVTDGSLTLGEWYLPGKTQAEVLISTHICHPSLANDGLSGTAVAAYLGRWLATKRRHFSYRILIIPATIGAIAWLSLNQKQVHRVRHGLVLSCLGDSGKLNYRRSRQGSAQIDRTVSQVLADTADDYIIHDFEPFGYDQRQYCSPGFDLPVGCLMRTPNGQYPEYHTSADDLSLVRSDALEHSFRTLTQICERLETSSARVLINNSPQCEPRLGKHGLYHAFGSRPDARKMQEAILWSLNLCDGRHSLSDIADRSGISEEVLDEATSLLEEHGFLSRLFRDDPAPLTHASAFDEVFAAHRN